MGVNFMGAKKTPIRANDPITTLIGRDLTLMDPDEAEMESIWEEIRAAYPKRIGGQSFPQAKKVFMDWVYNHGIDPNRILEGIKGFAENARVNNIAGTRFVPHLETFIRQSRYEAFVTPGEVDKAKRIGSVMSKIQSGIKIRGAKV